MSNLSLCSRCPRLLATRARTAIDYPGYHAAPVPAWGSRAARLLIVGLAPGMHGANKTGRPFCGDASGDFLFRGLYKAGFSSTESANTSKLHNTRITNAVKCLPPGNRPNGSEIANCRDYLRSELDDLLGRRPRRHRVILALGGVAYTSVCRTLGLKGRSFAHGACCEIANGSASLIASYHPSRLNTQTGRLTEAMFVEILQRIAELLED
jgi:uracil-DNA glycosylase family 4